MNKASKPSSARRPNVVVPAIVLAVLVIVAALAYKGLQTSSPGTAPVAGSVGGSAIPAARAHVAPAASADTPGVGEAPGSAVASTPAAPAAASEGAPADPKELVSTLAALDGKQPITPAQAEKWRDSLQQLVRQGTASVPIIQQFLAQNLDANYAGVSGAAALGYSSLRAALLDALGQIGGPEAIQAMVQVMQTSIFPTDIATLAKTLDAQAPGQYQQAILDAVRQQLSLGALGQLGGANVLPLYQVISTEAANGATVATDLAQYAEKWPYYSAITLAGLPDNAGLPSLIQMAQGQGPGNPTAATEALAELAPQNAQALSTLVDLAKNGQIPEAVLSQLAPYLAGRTLQLGPPQNPAAGGFLTYHMANGNQDFSAYDGGAALNQEQITQRISIIDQLIQVVPSSDPAALDALQQQRTALAARQKH